jgi:hypothetical protein
MRGFAARTELLGSLAPSEAPPPIVCRVAELRRRFDDALDAHVSGSTFARPSLLPSASLAGNVTSPGAASAPPPPRADAMPLSQPPPRADNTVSRRVAPESEARVAQDAATERVEGLMRAGRWHEVLRATEPLPDQARSFTLQLARAMAQRELTRRRAAIIPALLLVLLGVAAGFLLRHFGIGAGLPPR